MLRSLVIVALALLACLLVPRPVLANTRTWTGGSVANGGWTTAANWGGIVPAPGDDLVFPAGAARTTNTNDFPAGTSFHSIVFSGSGTGYTISGNGIALVAGISSTVDAGHTDTLSLAITLSADQTIDVTTSGARVVLNGVLSGAGINVTKTGAGTLQFAGNSSNTYSGTTTVADGVLELNKIGLSGVATAVGTLAIGDGTGSTNSAVVREIVNNQAIDSAAVTVNDDGLLDLNNQMDTIGPLTGSGNVSLGSGVLSTGVDNTPTAFSGTIAGTNGRLTKYGTGTFTLTGAAANTFTGLTTVNEGTLELAKAAGVNAIGGALLVGDGTNTDTVRLFADGQLPDSAAVTVSRTGVLDLDGFSETIGGLSLESGATSGAQVTTGAGTLTLGGNVTLTTSLAGGAVGAAIVGKLDLGGATRTFTIADGAAADDLTVAAAIGGSGAGLLKAGPGTLRMSGLASNTYGGTTIVGDGVLTLAKTVGAGVTTAIAGPLVIGDGSGAANSAVARMVLSNQIADGVSVTLMGEGLLDLNGRHDTIGPLAGGGTVSLGSGTLSAGGNNASTAYGGVISGAGGLTKIGTGTLTLSGTNSYTGATTIDAGTLLVNGSQPGSPVTLAGGILGGSGSVGAIVATSGTVSPGQSPGQLSSRDVTLTGSTAYTVEVNGTAAGTTYDQLNVTGAVTLGGAALNLSLGFPAQPGNAFTIIANDGGEAVSGTFAGLPPGAVIAQNDVLVQISYTGGSGNDVVLTVLPRQNVGVQVTPGGGVLHTSIVARPVSCIGGNAQLLSLQFTRLTNATVDVGPPASVTITTTPTTVNLPTHPSTISFTVHRITPGQAVTVELTVTDGCGTWKTFVGGGPGAF